MSEYAIGAPGQETRLANRRKSAWVVATVLFLLSLPCALDSIGKSRGSPRLACKVDEPPISPTDQSGKCAQRGNRNSNRWHPPARSYDQLGHGGSVSKSEYGHRFARIAAVLRVIRPIWKAIRNEPLIKRKSRDSLEIRSFDSRRLITWKGAGGRQTRPRLVHRPLDVGTAYSAHRGVQEFRDIP